MAINKYLTKDDTGKKELEVEAIVSSIGPDPDQPLVTPDPATGQWHPSLIPGAEVCELEASEALAANDIVNFFDDGGTIKVRKADASSYDTRAMGFVIVAVLAAATATVYGEGIVSGQSGLDPADEVFLSTTAGAITQTPPTGTGEIWQAVGSPISATQFKFEKGQSTCRA